MSFAMELILTLGVCAFLLLLALLLFRHLLVPSAGWGCPVLIVLRARGEFPELEQTVRALRGPWAVGGARLLIADEGMSNDARRRAELLARSEEGICLCGGGELPEEWKQD